MIEGRSHFAFVTHDADIMLHDFLQIALHGVRILARAVLEWLQCLPRVHVDLVALSI